MNNDIGKNTSVWIDTTPETNYPALSNDVEADVAIIGGGISGLSAAYFLKKAGEKVVVLESERIVNGTTGFTTAKITAAHGLIYKHLIEKFGREKAKVYADANLAAIEKIASIIKDSKIDADFKRLPAYTYTISENEINLIKAEVEAAKSLGLPVTFTTDLPLPYKVQGAIKYDNQARYHPRKYLLGLAKMIDGGGSFIFENTKVLKVEKGETVKIETDKGAVTAKSVLIATNSPIYDPNSFFARLSARQSLVVAASLKTEVPQGLFYSTEESFHSLRPQPYKDKEVLLVGGEHFRTGLGGDINKNYERLIGWAKNNFSVESIRYHWTTNDSESDDRVPLIGRIEPDSKNIFVATGFSGWGMTHGTIAGLIVSDLVLGKENSWSKLYDPKRLSTIFSTNSFKQNITSVVNLIGGKLAHRSKEIRLKNNEARVVGQGSGKIAVYKDEKGKIHAVSAICTHMGCTVNWNNAEKTWDCPCHGSRYSYDGKVIHGPTVIDLKKEIFEEK